MSLNKLLAHVYGSLHHLQAFGVPCVHGIRLAAGEIEVTLWPIFQENPAFNLITSKKHGII